MANSYSVKAVLSAVDKGFTGTIGKALSSVKSGLSSISFGALTSMGAKAFNTLSNGVSGLVSEINDSNAAWKTFEGNMSILGKGADEIDAAKKELQEFAQQTVYSSSDMAGTFAQLAAVGVKDTAKLVKGFGGLAAAAEDPQQAMKTLSQQATQMAAKPTVAWADFKLMLEQSPAGMAAVAKSMGMTTSELVTNIQAGTVKTEDFFDAINKVGTSKGFADLATEAKTMGQAMDGLKETLGNKLMPAFNTLSKIGIKAIDKISGALSKIDGQKIADKISGWIKKAEPMWNSFKKAVSTVWKIISGVGKKLAPVFQSVSESASGSFKGMLDAIGKVDVSKAIDEISAALMKLKPYFVALKNVVNAVKQAILALLPVVKKIIDFFLNNSEAIAKLIPWVLGLVGAFKAFNIIKTIVPAVASFAKSIASMAAKGIAGIASKLFGIAAAEKATGTASATAAPSLMQSALAILAIGGAVFLAAAGLALLVQSAIALASAGWPAVAALVGLVGVIALLAIGAAALGPALTAGAIGFIAFGAAIALVGLGAVLAGAGLALVASSLPLIVQYGLQGAVGIAALGAAMIVFAAGAALAGVACIALGAGLLVLSAAVIIFGAGMIVAAAGTLLMAAALLLVTAEMKSIAKSAKTAEQSLKAMRKSVDVVEAGLKTIKSVAKSAMEKLLSVFDNTATKVKASGLKIGKYFATGFANGMKSQLSVIKSVAAQMAAAAEEAVRAKAKIKSPSRVATGLGEYWGEGFTNGIANMAKDAYDAAAMLVSVPNVATPDMAMAFADEMSSDYGYYNSGEYVIEVPVVIDGKRVASVTAPYTQAELSKREHRESRKKGRV